MISLFVSTQLDLFTWPYPASADHWELIAGRKVWSRRLSWQWWNVLRANHDPLDLVHIRRALALDPAVTGGEAAIDRCETLIVPRDYRLPPGCEGWHLNPSRLAA